MSWTASTDNIAVTRYLVERCQGTGCTNFVQAGTSNDAHYGDAGLLAATTYRYRVRASDWAGNLSGYSNVASATTAAPREGAGQQKMIGRNPVGTERSCAFSAGANAPALRRHR